MSEMKKVGTLLMEGFVRAGLKSLCRCPGSTAGPDLRPMMRLDVIRSQSPALPPTAQELEVGREEGWGSDSPGIRGGQGGGMGLMGEGGCRGKCKSCHRRCQTFRVFCTDYDSCPLGLWQG
ncbi:hypothetical protein ACOMHN_008079 [Nucella lapillus]